MPSPGRALNVRASEMVKGPVCFDLRETGYAQNMYRYRTYRTAHGSGTAAAIVSAIGGLFALIEAVYILLLVFEANQTNKFFSFVKGLAEPLALFFPGLFNTGTFKLDVIINYGLAAVFWLVVTGIIARLLARF